MSKAGLLTVVAVMTASAAMASPVIDGAVIQERIWNDFPDSTLTYGTNYPSVWIQDENLLKDDIAPDYANKHLMRLSDNGGTSPAIFMNDDGFAYSADVTISGDLNAEAGLQIAPWWSNTDGVFMLRTDDGEISCWGGRLPFFNFTAEFGVHYVLGDTVRIGVIYEPNGLTEQDPGTIQYLLTDATGTDYASPVLAFDQGNPTEPEYGFYGILNGAQVGGFFQPKGDYGTANMSRVDFANISYVPEPASLMLLGVAGLFVLRRR